MSAIRYLSLSLLLSLSCGARAGDWQWLTVERGLPSTFVNDIMQDSYGFVWLATDNGISRFDGSSFKTYHAGTGSGSLTNEIVRSIAEDNSRGRLYFGTSRGLNIYEPSSHEFRRATLMFGEIPFDICYVTDVVVRKSGEVVISTAAGLLSLKGDTAAVQDYLQGHNRVLTMMEDRNERLWLVSDVDGVTCIGTEIADSLKDLAPCAICEDEKGRVFIGGEKGIYVFDDAGFSPVPATQGLNVFSMTSAGDGRLLIGTTENGAYMYNVEEATLSYALENEDFSDGKVSVVMVDRDGNTWMAFHQQGIYIESPQDVLFDYIGRKSTSADVIGNNCVVATYYDREGLLWVGTSGDGLYAIDLSQGTTRHYPAGANGMPPTVLSITEDNDGTVWVGSLFDGAGSVDRKTGAYRQLDCTRRIYANHVNAILADKRDNIWIGSSGAGLIRYNKSTTVCCLPSLLLSTNISPIPTSMWSCLPRRQVTVARSSTAA